MRHTDEILFLQPTGSDVGSSHGPSWRIYVTLHINTSESAVISTVIGGTEQSSEGQSTVNKQISTLQLKPVYWQSSTLQLKPAYWEIFNLH